MRNNTGLELVDLVQSYLRKELSSDEFCVLYENQFNFELDKRQTPTAQFDRLKELFDVVVWYSPYPEEAERIVGYKNEVEVREAALKFASLADKQE